LEGEGTEKGKKQGNGGESLDGVGGGGED